MATKKPSLDQRVISDKALRARVLANPGLRSKLSAATLQKYAPAQAKKRALNLRLAQPIVPGSSTTNRDLAQESKAAMDVKYGPLQADQQRALGQQQQEQRDVGGWYDQYLAAVRQHAANVGTIGTQAATAGQNLQQGVTGLGQAGLAQIQNPANADAAARGATAGDMAPLANQALAVRQALTGSFVAQQNAQNAASSGFADARANVVAPGQKLGALAVEGGKIKTARDKITETARERGASDLLYRSDRKTEEAKNILAAKALNLDTTVKKTQLDQSQQQIDETARHNQEQEELDATQIQANKDAKAAADANKASQPNKYGVPADQWAKWSTSHRTRWIADFNKKTGSSKPKAVDQGKKYRDDFFKKYGVYPVDTPTVNKAKDDHIPTASEWLDRLTKNGMTMDAAGRLLTVGQEPQPKFVTKKDVEDKKYPGKKEGDRIGSTTKIPKLPAVFIRVAMDQKRYKGKISASTAARLYKAGYSVASLGLQTVDPGSGNNPPSRTGLGDFG